MRKSIKLSNNVYWDPSSIKYATQLTRTANVGANKTLTITNSTQDSIAFIVTFRGTMGITHAIYFFTTYGAGGSSRSFYYKLAGHSQFDVTITISGTSFTVLNNMTSSLRCSILMLIGNLDDLVTSVN